MFKIGCHLSISKGFTAMGNDAIKIGANTFQFFTRNPRGTKAKDVDLEDIDGILEIVKKYKFSNILAHAPYTLNPCSINEKTRELALELISDDLSRMELLPNNLYNLHPGSHVGQGVETGINQIVSMLNYVLKAEQKTIVLLETMSGKGTEIGKNFEEIAEIIKKVDLNEKLGVCLDTCHINDAGYDIVNKLDEVLENFDKIIGFDRLYAIHLNDSMNSIGSHKDRHAKIGEGTIGIEAISNIINHSKLRNLPFYLETPNDLEGYCNEIKLLKGLYKF